MTQIETKHKKKDSSEAESFDIHGDTKDEDQSNRHKQD